MPNDSFGRTSRASSRNGGAHPLEATSVKGSHYRASVAWAVKVKSRRPDKTVGD